MEPTTTTTKPSSKSSASTSTRSCDAALLDIAHLDDYFMRLVLIMIPNDTAELWHSVLRQWMTRFQRLWRQHVLSNNNNNNNNNNHDEVETDPSPSFSPSSLSLTHVPPLQWWLLLWLKLSTLYATKGQTPAARILGLTMVQRQSQRHKHQSHPQQPQSTTKASISSLHAYAVLSIVFPMMYQWWKDRRPSSHYHPTNNNDHNNNPTTLLSQDQSSLARQRRAWAREQLQQASRLLVPILRFFTYLGFVTNCWTTPDLTMLLTGLRYQNNNNNNQTSPLLLHVDWGHRRWLHQQVWHTIRLYFIMRDLGRVSSSMYDVWKPIWHDCIVTRLQRLTLVVRKKQATGPNTTCPLCQSQPILIPVQTNCGHLYCYACLQSQQNQQILCRICWKTIARANFVQR